jgi:hypothetical protein
MLTCTNRVGHHGMTTAISGQRRDPASKSRSRVMASDPLTAAARRHLPMINHQRRR